MIGILFCSNAINCSALSQADLVNVAFSFNDVCANVFLLCQKLIGSEHCMLTPWHFLLTLAVSHSLCSDLHHMLSILKSYCSTSE